jgi:hypothetical protein
MQNSYWSDWENFLSRWGLKSTAQVLIAQARPLFPLMAQFMILGLPLFNSLTLGHQYSALINTLGNEEEIRQFSDFLTGGK